MGVGPAETVEHLEDLVLVQDRSRAGIDSWKSSQKKDAPLPPPSTSSSSRGAGAGRPTLPKRCANRFFGVNSPKRSIGVVLGLVINATNGITTINSRC